MNYRGQVTCIENIMDHRMEKENDKKGFETLPYEVVAWSSYISNFHPQFIKENSQEQSSRWSCESSGLREFVRLELQRPALLKAVMFGKSKNVNNCSVREVKVYTGSEIGKMKLVIHSGLHNDWVGETVLAQPTTLCRFVEIEPVRPVDPEFNMSISYVELLGSNSQEAIEEYRHFCDRQALKLCLKFLRRHGYEDFFRKLLHDTNTQLEMPVVGSIYSLLVRQGDFMAVEERLVQLGLHQNIFNEYVSKRPYKFEWKLLDFEQWQQSAMFGQIGYKPPMRGGHQCVLDVEGRLMYLFGGWNGKSELGDFWRYDIVRFAWTCISRDVAADNGPCARSCHRLCIDRNKKIYVLGRYCKDPEPNDFFAYDTKQKKWIKISADVSRRVHLYHGNFRLEGGPKLLYDHQMVYWEKGNSLLVHGGRICGVQQEYGEFYQYNLSTRIWTLLIRQSGGPQDVIPSRTAHSIFVCEETSRLYIFGGQMERNNLADLYYYDLLEHRVVLLDPDCSIKVQPSLCSSQRVIFDPEAREMRLLAGARIDDSMTFQNDPVLFICNIDTLKWEQISFSVSGSDAPCRRYGHQFIWDPITKQHFVSAGNPGLVDSQNLRLSDLWALRLWRPSQRKVLQECIRLLRKHWFKELAITDPLAAYSFLHGPLREVYDINDSCQCKQYLDFASELFRHSSETLDQQSIFRMRTDLFETLMEYFPNDMKQPSADISELVELPTSLSDLPYL